VEKWRFSTISGLWIQTSPTISSDGTIYFGDGDYLYALYPNETLKWTNRINSETLGSTPAIDENGTIYIGTWGYILYSIYPNGTTKWTFNAHETIADSPAIGKDGTVYFGTMDYTIFAINSKGKEKWRYTTGYKIVSSPAIGDDGTVYIGSGDHYIYALYPNGTLRWRFQTGDEIHGDPSIALDGTIYITSYDGYLYALSPNGTQRWKIAVGWGSQSNSAIASDGTIYVGGDHLYAIYPNGTMRWIFDLGTERWIGLCSPALSADGTIYVGAIIGDGHGGELLGVNPNGTEHLRKYVAAYGIENSPAIASDGTIYIPVDDFYGDLVAIGRGPIIVDAYGPYSGYYQQPIQFTGTVYGGIPPYIYHWDFGDGQSSNVQSPTHNYSSVGNFTATFAVTDSEGNSSSDTAMVTISYKAPSVSITKPVKGLYIKDIRILPLRKCIIIGPITIEADAHQEPLGIARVEFSIDGKLKATDTEAPYSWTWSVLSFSKHTITVTTYDTSGKNAQASITVWKFF
jgi:outer membrane protein assembly factor BamB